MRRNLALFIAFIILIFVFFLSAGNINQNKQMSVILGGKTYFVGVAKTETEREKGLSGVKSLSENHGKLFIFERSDKYGFWMKDMNFSIDIIWISSDFKIVGLQKSLSPETYPQVYYPDAPAQYVLEISADESEKLNVKIGDLVEFSKK